MLLFAEREETNDITGRHRIQFVSKEFRTNVSIILNIQIENNELSYANLYS